jgi:hypothetical protein
MSQNLEIDKMVTKGIPWDDLPDKSRRITVKAVEPVPVPAPKEEDRNFTNDGLKTFLKNMHVSNKLRTLIIV